MIKVSDTMVGQGFTEPSAPHSRSSEGPCHWNPPALIQCDRPRQRQSCIHLPTTKVTSAEWLNPLRMEIKNIDSLPFCRTVISARVSSVRGTSIAQARKGKANKGFLFPPWKICWKLRCLFLWRFGRNSSHSCSLHLDNMGTLPKREVLMMRQL